MVFGCSSGQASRRVRAGVPVLQQLPANPLVIVAKLLPLAAQAPSQAKYLHVSLYWPLLLIRAKTIATIAFEKGCPQDLFPKLLVLFPRTWAAAPWWLSCIAKREAIAIPTVL